MRKPLTTAILATITLSGCTGSGTVSYRATFSDRLNPVHLQELALATGRVVERRVQSMSGKTKNATVKTETKGAVVTATVDPPALIEPLTSQLTGPFALSLMRGARAGEKADLMVQNRGFMNTDVTQDHIEWIQSQETQDKKGAVLITFTEEGKQKVKAVLSSTRGLNVALFVRGQIVSSFQNTTGEARENILIENIPSFDLASAFADDVNVGTYATFAKQ